LELINLITSNHRRFATSQRDALLSMDESKKAETALLFHN